MSRPTAISPEEQEQIARRIGVLLLQAAPEDWQQITVEYRATGEYHDLLGEVAAEDGGTEPWEPPEELWGIFEHLREGMYRPEVGTWLSALYVVERPSSYRIDINFDAEPQWQRPLPAAAYVDELRRYPRTDDNIPDWMRAKLDGSAASPAAEAPAAEAQPVRAEAPEQFAAAAAQPAAPAAAASAVPSAAQASAGQPPQPGPAPAATTTTDQPSGSPSPAAGGRFRTARAFDEFDEQGRPLVSGRAPVAHDEVAPLRHYLENAPIVVASRDNEDDQLDPNAPAAVPATWHTDGTWVWPGSVAYYLVQYGVPPQGELVEHVRARRFALGEVDDATRDAAVRELQDAQLAPAGAQASPEPPAGETAEPARNGFEQAGFQPGFEAASGFEAPSGFAPGLDDRDAEQRDFAVQLPSPDDDRAEQPAAESRPEPDEPAEPGSRHGLGAAAEEDDLDDEQAVLARLHDRLTELGVNSADYRIGSHASTARCLLREGPDWIVTAGEDDLHGDVRFQHADQAAAFLLGSLLLSSTEPLPAEAPAQELPEPDEPARADAAERSAPAAQARAEQPAAEEPEAAQFDASPRFDPSSQFDAAARFEAARPEAAQADAARSDAAGSEMARSEVAQSEPAQSEAGLPETAQAEMAPSETALPETAQSETAQPEIAQPDAAQSTPDAAPAEEEPAQSARAESAPDETAEQPAADQPFAPFSPAKEPADEGDSDRPAIGALPKRTPSTPEPPQQNRPAASPGGNFLFTANQEPEPDAGRPEPPAQQPAAQQPAAQQPPQQGEEATRFQPMPQVGQQQPGGAPQNGFAPAPGAPRPDQQPPQQGPGGGLPQRTPQDPNRPPAAPGPQGAPAPNGERRPGPAGPGMSAPPRQGEPPQNRPGGPIKRPPQQGPQPQPPQGQPQQPQQGSQPQSGQPAQQPAQQQPAQQQSAQQPQGQGGQIQPLRGEPPLTLYRDRRQLVLQPGTELDRFGEPAGNVTYAAHTPYNLRSLPPQWSARPYAAYRVQRPLNALRGTAVPWFEQPGGGTAYVLPSAISDLLADGSLVEIPEAQRPPME